MRLAIWFVCLLPGGIPGFAAPAHVLKTTCKFAGDIGYECTDAGFTVEFPELCPGECRLSYQSLPS